MGGIPQNRDQVVIERRVYRPPFVVVACNRVVVGCGRLWTAVGHEKKGIPAAGIPRHQRWVYGPSIVVAGCSGVVVGCGGLWRAVGGEKKRNTSQSWYF